MEPDLPIWARPEAFPPADDGWGWVDRKGNRSSCESLEALTEAIVNDAGARVDLVWTPDHDFLVLPEELPELHSALKKARIRWAEWEIKEGKRQMLLFSVGIVLVTALSLYQGKLHLGALIIAGILFVILGFFPWYSGIKRLRRAQRWVENAAEEDFSDLRFETWLLYQKAPFTRAFFILLLVVGIVQWLSPGTAMNTYKKAALIKDQGQIEDWWRLATAPFIHGHIIHFVFNASALLYLGRRVEVLVGWSHVALLFVLSAWAGGHVSAWYMPGGFAVGASGGLLGMLGFLLVFESMHRVLVPASSRRRLVAALLLTAALGVVLYKIVDNGAHAGGLVVGMFYAFAVFPKSASARRPRQLKTDMIAGLIAGIVLLASAAWTCLLLMEWVKV